MRLGKLSERRNAAAHPDGGLLLAVRSLALQHEQLLKYGGDELQLEQLRERIRKVREKVH